MKITTLKPEELLVVGVTSSGKHSFGLAKFAKEQGWLTVGNNGGLDISGKTFAIDMFHGLESVSNQLSQLVAYKQAHPNKIILMTDFGLRSATYNRFELWEIIKPNAEYFDFTYADLLQNTRQGVSPLRGEFYLAHLEKELENALQYQVTKVFYNKDSAQWVAFEPWKGYFNTLTGKVTGNQLKQFISEHIEKLKLQKEEAAQATLEDFVINDFYESEGIPEVHSEADARKFIKEYLDRGYQILAQD